MVETSGQHADIEYRLDAVVFESLDDSLSVFGFCFCTHDGRARGSVVHLGCLIHRRAEHEHTLRVFFPVLHSAGELILSRFHELVEFDCVELRTRCVEWHILLVDDAGIYVEEHIDNHGQ